MPTQNKSLREYRKSSPLNQSDIAFLLQLPDISNVSRWEHGQRTPNTEALLVYHLLFGTPVANLLNQSKENMCLLLKERIALLLTELHNRRPSQKVNSRIAFLESIVINLSA